MSFRLCTLASGSEGNVCFVQVQDTRILIDAGISYKQLCQALQELGTGPETVSAVLLTHEHSDHTAGLPLLMRKNGIPVYTTAGTFAGLAEQKLFEKLPKSGFHLISFREPFTVGPLRITAFPTQHDAKESAAFRIDTEEASLAVVTDLGSYDDDLTEAMQGLNALLLEANHNPQMLAAGPYPYPLKLRIESEAGHLSNEAAAAFLASICHKGLKSVLLGHLSRINNYPPLALETVRRALLEQHCSDIPDLYVAPPRGLSDILTD